MLRGINLACVRGERPLFGGVGFALDRGQWLHVRGANGVGKTSLLRIVAGLSQPEMGEVRWNDAPICKTTHAYRSSMLFLGHQGALKEDLSALENIELAGALDGSPPSRAAVLAALRRFGLQRREELPVRVLSAGQKRRVLLARLLTRKATLWVLDEPFTALDAPAVQMLGTLLGEHIAAGGMAVVTSHQNVPLSGGLSLDLDAAARQPLAQQRPHGAAAAVLGAAA